MSENRKTPASAATLTGGGGNRGSFQAGHHDNPISAAGRQRMGKDTTSYLRERMPAGELQQMIKNGVSTEEIVAAVERIEARGGLYIAGDGSRAVPEWEPGDKKCHPALETITAAGLQKRIYLQ